ncbi:glycosyltransferase [Sulfurimonas sp. C5]|uniref:glycosyltransferase n=1 Tax=Sulfurimonas sp. C5 TaxID=3036947 RepID=UPI002456818C|nr:glycosyltransferase [Sulfurimonas sp. C5]MDH4943440.1 glycosyltransferase [Sulfurimonas sp. C5]
MERTKVAACVVLFNPEDDIFENISSYVAHVGSLIIVDNSTVHNQTLIQKILDTFQNIEYINNHDNLGIATALNIGCNKALEDGYDWILTMDQDSRFINFSHYLSCLENLKNTDEIAILSANTNYNEEMEIPNEAICSYEEKFSAITSANLLNLKLFEKIGKFEDKLFIDLVDYDYCIKAQIHNFKVLYFPNIFVKHALGTVFLRKNLFTKKTRAKREHNPQRTYYFARNYLYLSSKYGKYFPKELNMLKILNILFIHEVTKILLYEDQKGAKLRAKFIGLLHFFTNKFGKYIV